MSEPGRSFDETAPTYAAVRPAYPQAALDWLVPDWLVPDGTRRLLDLGAGTGKLTRQLADLGLDVVAVEPSLQMAAELADWVPEAELRLGAAEDLPLPDACVDAVFVGSAFHWFEHGAALAEIRRVLRPGGTFGLIRNRPDDSVAWIAELDELTGARARRGKRNPVPQDTTGFQHVATAEFGHRHPVTKGALLALLQTYSYYLLLDTPSRARLLADVGRLVDTHPALAGRTGFELQFVTLCWRGIRR